MFGQRRSVYRCINGRHINGQISGQILRDQPRVEPIAFELIALNPLNTLLNRSFNRNLNGFLNSFCCDRVSCTSELSSMTSTGTTNRLPSAIVPGLEELL